ncbi:phosphohistidine phosphatase SixA [Shewanella sp. Choline-02u-19]|uniref:phosphohistidine phosphatase SixA n=1 Tax=unclassified Shewanella TaxID=196818 RepID=UPI000C32B0D9|nr:MULTISPECIES: phosphohistidine phosphatase SixA [unclassified Shewanella]PKG59203.1 phosphohistidine phosphatase SixA [Shewanella sp. GutDb-MelDb]PKG75612.1 phosphohistidine phosphatase SixA [Shewanella sp. GutCb]PKH56470.1 phosphohistidine phosphatase SixA [Shewanella sp. Bg11-22]PKI28024.1 phosphohistidine phosphatase SixA [Shewanella sp. Choline-02u-19]
MQLFLMRHGEAGFNAHSDRERTLTDTGRQHTGLMSNWLGQSVTEFDLVLVSPYLRAQQSWQEMHQHFPEPRQWLTLDELVPSGDPATVAETVLAYAEHYKAENVLVLAHMPLLGYLVSELVPGFEPPLFATSGVTLINKQTTQASVEWQYAPHMIC